VLPAGHPLAARDVVDLVDLAGEPWVGGEPPGPCLEPIIAACAAAGFSPDFVAKSEDYATAQGFVAAGLGVTLIPRLGLATCHPDVEVRPVRHPEPVRAIYAAVREGALAQPALRTLIDSLVDAAGSGRQGGSGTGRDEARRSSSRPLIHCGRPPAS
jgi:DNA-binding transcriptional LysR family regulator